MAYLTEEEHDQASQLAGQLGLSDSSLVRQLLKTAWMRRESGTSYTARVFTAPIDEPTGWYWELRYNDEDCDSGYSPYDEADAWRRAQEAAGRNEARVLVPWQRISA